MHLYVIMPQACSCVACLLRVGIFCGYSLSIYLGQPECDTKHGDRLMSQQHTVQMHGKGGGALELETNTTMAIFPTPGKDERTRP